MSNGKIKPVDLRHGLVWFVVGECMHIEVTMDWTDFDKDDQTMLVISLVLKHGRANVQYTRGPPFRSSKPRCPTASPSR